MEWNREQRELAIETLSMAPPSSLLEDPIEYIFADHFRQRTLCSVLHEIADGDAPDKKLIMAAIKFLQGDFGLHIRDEEQDLFPTLKKCASDDEELNDVLEQLSQEHEDDRIDAERIVESLQYYMLESSEGAADEELQGLLRRFADNENQHLMTENAIVLPIARSTLMASDLKELSGKMARRRGMEVKPVAPC